MTRDITQVNIDQNIECVRCHAIKIKSKTMQRIKSKNCGIVDDKNRKQFSKFKVCALSQREPSMEHFS